MDVMEACCPAFEPAPSVFDVPLFNRAVQGQYPPGSTIKPILGMAGLHHGVVTADTKIYDPGWYRLPTDERRYRDWKQ